ncbi:hypothetical protein [Paraburkholderia metrosideri]|uniref:Transposase n=1 Tax=Paraburkholderia metrosideri TaxID=580937 RepID=A0ABN7HNS0_9BURK|nr:hypothetical protein [Paraburkholderia metrosideri]CAD6528782.1 hypothetical protein LMG28140_02189 [Paraburkholderia metrosideri]
MIDMKAFEPIAIDHPAGLSARKKSLSGGPAQGKTLRVWIGMLMPFNTARDTQPFLVLERAPLRI